MAPKNTIPCDRLEGHPEIPVIPPCDRRPKREYVGPEHAVGLLPVPRGAPAYPVPAIRRSTVPVSYVARYDAESPGNGQSLGS